MPRHFYKAQFTKIFITLSLHEDDFSLVSPTVVPNETLSSADLSLHDEVKILKKM